MGGPPYAPWRDQPFATVTAEAGAMRLAAVNPAARYGGVDPGLSLSDARAVLPALKAIDADAETDRACLGKVLAWMRRYTPWAAIDGLDGRGGAGLWLDITGCAHLFGGEAAVLGDLSYRLDKLGFASCLGVADTPGAAWAMAHCRASEHMPAVLGTGAQRGELERIPVSGLRLAPRTRETLTRLGVRTVADIAALPRAQITRRFGSEVCLRLDQFTGRVDEPLSPEMERVPYVARMAFPEPIGRTEDIEAALQRLLKRLCERLEKDRRGARRLACELFRVDNTAERIAIGTGQAVRQPDHLFRLFREKLDGLDAGFGIEFVLLTVTATDPLAQDQAGLVRVAEEKPGDKNSTGRELALLVDRLEGRLGAGRVVRPRRQASHIPERAVGLVPALSKSKLVASPSDQRERNVLHGEIDPLRAGSRSLHLLPKPEPVAPVDALPEIALPRGMPLPGFEWRHGLYRLTAAEGPERIAGAWWRGPLPPDRSGGDESYFTLCADGGAVRDYWRVECETGARFWLFHLPFPLQREITSSLPRWFLHGLFA
jgi:protein ImuB